MLTQKNLKARWLQLPALFDLLTGADVVKRISKVEANQKFNPVILNITACPFLTRNFVTHKVVTIKYNWQVLTYVSL